MTKRLPLPKTLASRLILVSLIFLFILQVVVISLFVMDMNDKRLKNAVKYSTVKLENIVRLLDNSDYSLYDDILNVNKSYGIFLFFSEYPIIPKQRNIKLEKSTLRELYNNKNRELYISTYQSFSEYPTMGMHLKKNIQDLSKQNKVEIKDYDFQNMHLINDTKHVKKLILNQNEVAPYVKDYLLKNTNTDPEKIEHLDSNTPIYFASIKLENGNYLIFANLSPNRLLPPISNKILYTIIGTTLLGTLIFYLLLNEITSPLKKLAKQAEIISKNYKSPSLPIEGPQEIRELLTSFNRMQKSLTDFISDRTRILASISHDLKTPLTSMMLRAEFLEDSEDKEKLINTIDIMTKMVKATLEFAKSEEKSSELKNINVPTFIETICQNYIDLNKDVKFIPKTNFSKILNFYCNPVELHRIIQNLIDNAIEYGTNANVLLYETEIEMIIEVIDNGPGIPEEKLEEVFAPFTRLDEARNTSNAHIGLGLSIVRNTILKHGAKILLSNNEPHGLKVTIKYPL